ncbi:hypothetical protein NIES2107_08810 [Nostoc carneum NIES-2107]|nr:hypothetical protein NIES2107_08810 [Nostoc carneum NIES-2107]
MELLLELSNYCHKELKYSPNSSNDETESLVMAQAPKLTTPKTKILVFP